MSEDKLSFQELQQMLQWADDLERLAKQGLEVHQQQPEKEYGDRELLRLSQQLRQVTLALMSE